MQVAKQQKQNKTKKTTTTKNVCFSVTVMAAKRSSESWLLERQKSMVMRAAEEGMGNLVLFALETNPAVDGKRLSEGKSGQNAPLITACLKGHLDVARNLVDKCKASLECRADVTLDEQDIPGVTPLWAASYSGNLELVK